MSEKTNQDPDETPVPEAAPTPLPGSPASRATRSTLVLGTPGPAPRPTPPSAPTPSVASAPAPASPPVSSSTPDADESESSYQPYVAPEPKEKPLPLRLRRPTKGRVQAVVGLALLFSLLSAFLWWRFEWVVASPVLALAAFYLWQCVSVALRHRRAVAHEREQRSARE